MGCRLEHIGDLESGSQKANCVPPSGTTSLRRVTGKGYTSAVDAGADKAISRTCKHQVFVIVPCEMPQYCEQRADAELRTRNTTLCIEGRRATASC